MRKINICLMFLILCLFPATRSEALWDLFVVYNARNTKVSEIICNALSTPKEKWDRCRLPVSEEFNNCSAYKLENDDKKKPSKLVLLDELHHAKHPTCRTLDAIFSKVKESNKRYIIQLISQDADTITFEVTDESIDPHFREHGVHWITDLGKCEYRWYIYRVFNRLMTEEEKAEMLAKFQKIETQLRALKL